MKNRLLARVLITLIAPLLIVFSGCAYGPRVQESAQPVLLVHGDDASASYWQDLVWRFESNGWPRERLVALQLAHPRAPDDAAKAQPGRSTDTEQLAFLQAQVAQVLARTGAKQVVLIGQGRGAYAIRNYILNGGGDQTVSHAVLSWPEGPWAGAKSPLTVKDYETAALKGVKSLVIAQSEQRDGAFSPASFAASYRFITGQEPRSQTIWPQVALVLDGQVTGMGVQSGDRASEATHYFNNLPVPKARVEVFAVQADTGLRLGPAVYEKAVGADGRWGPFRAQQGQAYEFVVRAPGYAVTHIYRSPFPRGSQLVHLKADRIADADLRAFSIIQLERPRGYLDPTVSHVSFDGQSPPPGVAQTGGGRVTSSKITLGKAPSRAIAAEIHTDAVERVTGRTWSAKDNHVVRLELSQ
ncbi:twin-arginine translocation pathway signal [Rhodoferax sp.]|uniref:twin-arginine translocation pathway signal n=1 Tax=Rhodoferax sp. TaxID=50421 RepID=UPI0026095BBE|nr:twin-arginine translocation pathway signal [Rhodoferax sp.]MDD2924110.1 twin-arginine translocation pathway signal [Rhodoferax sp.]